jgi:hypothetical protein
MTIPPEDLVNLDIVIAEFIAPRLQAFRDVTDSFPEDLDDMGEWHAELDEMIAAFHVIGHPSNPNDDTAVPYTPVHQARLALFARRLGHLWQ